MTSKISINPDRINDPNYRYKMPEIKTKTNGSGTHGVTTILTNIEDLSNTLRMPKDIILQYIGKSIGTNVTENINAIKGSLNQKDAQQYIYKLINIVSYVKIVNFLNYILRKMILVITIF